jgi:hypothetical protein
LPIPCKCLKELAGTTGLEPAASAVTGQRSNQLNYVPIRQINKLPKTLAGQAFCKSRTSALIEALSPGSTLLKPIRNHQKIVGALRRKSNLSIEPPRVLPARITESTTSARGHVLTTAVGQWHTFPSKRRGIRLRTVIMRRSSLNSWSCQWERLANPQIQPAPYRNARRRLRTTHDLRS